MRLTVNGHCFHKSRNRVVYAQTHHSVSVPIRSRRTESVASSVLCRTSLDWTHPRNRRVQVGFPSSEVVLKQFHEVCKSSGTRFSIGFVKLGVKQRDWRNSTSTNRGQCPLFTTGHRAKFRVPPLCELVNPWPKPPLAKLVSEWTEDWAFSRPWASSRPPVWPLVATLNLFRASSP